MSSILRRKNVFFEQKSLVRNLSITGNYRKNVYTYLRLYIYL